jgi:hypothetical protein
MGIVVSILLLPAHLFCIHPWRYRQYGASKMFTPMLGRCPKRRDYELADRVSKQVERLRTAASTITMH